MAINGIKRVRFGVDDVAEAVRFITDFGLGEPEWNGQSALFRVPEGSIVEVHPSDAADLPPPYVDGNGPREVIWGVETQDDLDSIAADLGRDRKVSVDDRGVLHAVDDCGIPIGFELYQRVPPVTEAEPENTLSDIRRWDRHRRWYDQARPKVLFHVVFGVADVDRGVAFYTQRLKFRVTDMNRGLGVFMRAEGRAEHHNLFLLKSPKPLFSHISFGVDNIDELMAGANTMQRQGWSAGVGLGRHRVSSLIFYYLRSPLGGQFEYSADGDYLTDAWQPRLWDTHFGHLHWVAQAAAGAQPHPGTSEILTNPPPPLAETVRERSPGGERE